MAATRGAKQDGGQSPVPRTCRPPLAAPLCRGQKPLYAVPRLRRNDSRVLARVVLLSLPHAANVELVGQQALQRVFAERTTPVAPASLCRPRLVGPATLGQLPQCRFKAPGVEREIEDGPHPLRLRFVDPQPGSGWIEVIAQHQTPTRPFAFAARCRLLIACALADDLPLELGKR